jgi:hypothetical protein
VIRRLHRAEDGIGVVTALMVTFIVFTLGASWYAISVHELDEVTFDRHRTQSIHATDAGVRDAMYRLANDDSVRSAAQGAGSWSSPIVSGTCDLTELTSGSGVVGQYWLRISDATPSELTDLRYFIESWGWAPTSQSRQANQKKIELELELIPAGGGFEYALYVGNQGLVGAQKKVLYGDAYSGQDATIQQLTEIKPNDGGYPGDGHLRIYEDLTISNSLTVAGTVTVNDYITQGLGSNAAVGELIGVNNPPNGGGNPAYDTFLRKMAISGTARFGTGRNYSTGPPNQVTAGGGIVHNATGLVPVPFEALPGFDWDEVTDPPYTPKTLYTGVNAWDDFMSWVSSDPTALTGAHYVQNTGQSTSWNMNGHTFADDFILVVDGSVTLAGSPSFDAANAPITVTVAGNQATSQVSAGAPVLVTSDDLRFLIYSKGTANIGLPTLIYGALYAEQGVSGTNLEIHFRPPETAGFIWDPSLATSYTPRPGVWREASASAPPCTVP